jgi:hypothetical protein
MYGKNLKLIALCSGVGLFAANSPAQSTQPAQSSQSADPSELADIDLSVPDLSLPDLTLPGLVKDVYKPPVWNTFVTYQLGGGFKDNIAISPLRPESSPVLRNLFDVTFMRLPTDGGQFFVLSSWDDVRYVTGEDVDKEQTGLVLAHYKRETESGWDISAAGQYVYQNQVLDLSSTLAIPQILKVEGNTFAGTTTFRRFMIGRWWAELELELSRQDFLAPLDDYWEFGPRVEVAKWWGKNEFALSYELQHRVYDNRGEPETDGFDRPGTGLEFLQHEIEWRWVQNWDANRTWRTTTKVRRELSKDNGAGFYSYRRWRVSEQIRYRKGDWDLGLEFGWSTYVYPGQVRAEGEEGRRQRNDWLVNLRAVRSWSSRWKSYLEYDYELSSSNLADTSYSANFVQAGVIFEY